MSYPIKFLSLQKAELQYEVELRGGSGESVQELRKEIVKLSQIIPSEDVLESHLTAADDLKEVKESLLKSQNNLTSLKNKFDTNLYNRTENLLHHIYHRFKRIINIPEVNDIYKTCASSFNSQFKELSLLKPSSLHTPSTGDFAATSNISVTCERSLSSDINKLKFNGTNCVYSFIQKVEEFVHSRGISFEKILMLAYEIFEGDALHWFRYNKDNVTSWSDLCTLLKKDFSSSDYDYRLAAEIRSRTQGEHENITIYISIMHGMISRLNKAMTENEKLEIILHNIRPCYANTLAASPNITSIDELMTVCKNYENIKARSSNFQEPPRVSSSTIAPEFAYSYEGNNKIDFKNKQYNKPKPNTYYSYTTNKTNTNYDGDKKYNFSNNNNQKLHVAAITTQSSKPPYCPRCRSDSHSLSTCSQDRFLICFKCGKKDVRYPECPSCHREPSNDPPKN